MMFLLQSVPIVTLNLYGVVGLIISFMIATLCQVLNQTATVISESGKGRMVVALESYHRITLDYPPDKG